ncbi:LysR substrate-binding domain-containing protein [Kineococcus rhizosphaerae]|uniref:LysR family transcriptional regulator n=1 Tax=Kineococcus rhizosphaerae TaxID=559628 RepID=A0A2T0R6Z5_9ACTN|nr:LysR substrate-binding domain-containing protein [Kineococcus rhizosphaerae]PRY16945.1 LysR family transcriptional regulator [Kineococcus rhizosphaerae]
MSREFTLTQLRYFAAVAQEQSVTVAAARLRISQSALSSAVAQLEAAMGTALFRRVPRRGVELTESGLRLLHESLPLLEAAEELPARVRQDHQAPAGRLVVGVYEPIASLRLPEIVAAFGRRHPAVEVSIVEGDQEFVRQSVLSGGCEIALLYSMGLGAGLRTEVLEELPPHVIVGERHALATRTRPVSLRELADEPLVLLDLPHTREYLLGLFDVVGVVPRVRHRLTGYETVRSFVAHDGYAVLNRRLPHGTTHTRGRVVALDLAERLPPVQVVLAQAPDARPTRRAAAFADVCRQVVRV